MASLPLKDLLTLFMCIIPVFDKSNNITNICKYLIHAILLHYNETAVYLHSQLLALICSLMRYY